MVESSLTQDPKLAGMISLCMIVRDEEKRLRACLESVRDVVDQMVIVDTGSEDGTVELAKSLGAEVHHFTWCDDFSAARNESIKYARGDWILWMDADEVLADESKAELRQICSQKGKPAIRLVTIRSSRAGGAQIHDSDAHRLFTNGCGIQFSGVIHEQVAPSASKLKAKEKTSGIMLYHSGYDLDAAAQARKLARNQPLLERMVRDEPQNAFAHFWLAQNYAQQDEHKKALKHLHRSLELKQFNQTFRASALNITAQVYIESGQPEQVLRLTKESLKLVPMQFGALYLQFRLAMQRKNWAETARLLEKLVQNTRYLLTHPKVISTDTLAPLDKILVQLGEVYLKTGEQTKALQSFQDALKEGAAPALLRRVIALARDLNNLPVLLSALKDYLKNEPEDIEALDLMAMAYIKGQDFKAALETYQHISHLRPDLLKVKERLAALYAKLNQPDKAAAILTELQNPK